MGRVAGIIAHEINNPLEAIINAFYLLRDHPSLDDEARQLRAAWAKKSCCGSRTSSGRRLGFYRESQHPIASLDSRSSRQCSGACNRDICRSIGIELEKLYQTDATVFGFPVELKQVFLNLIGNAVQAMPDGGRLRLRVRERTDPQDASCAALAVSVCDTGSGIKPEDAKQLFEPFFSTKSTKGTGLGLWISKGIVQKYEGTIQFRSVRTARGSRHLFPRFPAGTCLGQHPESFGRRRRCLRSSEWRCPCLTRDRSSSASMTKPFR